jgi:hypothetical protein
LLIRGRHSREDIKEKQINSVDTVSRGAGQRRPVADQCLRIAVTASGGKWRAVFGGKLVCVSSCPFVMAARALITRGFDPNCVIEMYHAGADAWALRGRLGAVAATLLDGEQKGPRCARNGAPVRFSRTAMGR